MIEMILVTVLFALVIAGVIATIHSLYSVNDYVKDHLRTSADMAKLIAYDEEDIKHELEQQAEQQEEQETDK